MANKTKITWCDVTVNPFPGCRHVSPGCDHCYAERMARRLKAMGQSQYQAVVDETGWTGEVGCNPAVMDIPGRSKLVFVQSMGDPFYEGIADEQRDWAFDKMLAQPEHTFMVLTKRVQRATSYHLKRLFFYDGQCADDPLIAARNIWFGWTAEDQQRLDERTPFGLQVPAAVRFVSFEPLLGPIYTSDYLEYFRHPQDSLRHSKAGVGPWKNGWLDWVIVGCETGPKRRPCDPRWVAAIVRQCHESRTPVFVKQIEIGLDGEIVNDADRIALELSDYVGSPLCAEDIRQWPAGGSAK